VAAEEKRRARAAQFAEKTPNCVSRTGLCVGPVEELWFERMAWNLHYYISINQLVPPPIPSVSFFRNHRVGGDFSDLVFGFLKDFYPSIPA